MNCENSENELTRVHPKTLTAQEWWLIATLMERGLESMEYDPDERDVRIMMKARPLLKEIQEDVSIIRDITPVRKLPIEVK